jgi:uncharacterized protein YjiS (DUF1127 family)
MSTQAISSRENVFVASPSAPSKLARLAEIIRQWRRRAASRQELACLSELDLKDIGYPAGAAAEKAKPFWRD